MQAESETPPEGFDYAEAKRQAERRNQPDRAEQEAEAMSQIFRISERACDLNHSTPRTINELDDRRHDLERAMTQINDIATTRRPNTALLAEAS